MPQQTHKDQNSTTWSKIEKPNSNPTYAVENYSPNTQKQKPESLETSRAPKGFT